MTRRGSRCNLSPWRPIQYVAMTRTHPGPVKLRRDLSPKSDGDAVDATLAASGDAHAFERLYRGHIGRIVSLARRMLSEDEADEAAQDVFVRAWSRLASFRGDSQFSTWLHRIAVNAVLQKRRGDKRRELRVETRDAEQLAEAPAVRVTMAERMDLERAVAALPEGARAVFLLHDVQGYKHHEIADMMGLAVGTTKAQLHRARRLLREALER